jgi:hypothetical protein
MPREYVGGSGDKGAAALKEFVEQGNTLILLNHASGIWAWRAGPGTFPRALAIPVKLSSKKHQASIKTYSTHAGDTVPRSGRMKTEFQT